MSRINVISDDEAIFDRNGFLLTISENGNAVLITELLLNRLNIGGSLFQIKL